jgi:cytidylate kinase
LKKLSEDRIQHWPNTLDANRTKKESFMKDREAKDELRRQEIDKQVCAYAFLSFVSSERDLCRRIFPFFFCRINNMKEISFHGNF